MKISASQLRKRCGELPPMPPLPRLRDDSQQPAHARSAGPQTGFGRFPAHRPGPGSRGLRERTFFRGGLSAPISGNVKGNAENIRSSRKASVRPGEEAAGACEKMLCNDEYRRRFGRVGRSSGSMRNGLPDSNALALNVEAAGAGAMRERFCPMIVMVLTLPAKSADAPECICLMKVPLAADGPGRRDYQSALNPGERESKALTQP